MVKLAGWDKSKTIEKVSLCSVFASWRGPIKKSNWTETATSPQRCSWVMAGGLGEIRDCGTASSSRIPLHPSWPSRANLPPLERPTTLKPALNSAFKVFNSLLFTAPCTLRLTKAFLDTPRILMHFGIPLCLAAIRKSEAPAFPCAI